MIIPLEETNRVEKWNHIFMSRIQLQRYPRAWSTCKKAYNVCVKWRFPFHSKGFFLLLPHRLCRYNHDRHINEQKSGLFFYCNYYLFNQTIFQDLWEESEYQRYFEQKMTHFYVEVEGMITLMIEAIQVFVWILHSLTNVTQTISQIPRNRHTSNLRPTRLSICMENQVNTLKLHPYCWM